jgi:hypothetical protein
MKLPYDERGRKVSTACPNPDCSGTLQHQGYGFWTCDGLIDPNDPDKELETCEFTHQDGEPHNATTERHNAWAKARGKFVFDARCASAPYAGKETR